MIWRPSSLSHDFRENLVYRNMAEVEVGRQFTRCILPWFISRFGVTSQLISQEFSQHPLSGRASSSRLHRGNPVIQRNTGKHPVSRVQESRRSLGPSLQYLCRKNCWFWQLCAQESIGLGKFAQMSRKLTLQEATKSKSC